MTSPSVPTRLMGDAPPRLVLASGSAIRATLLRQAGLLIEVAPVPVDESAVKAAMRADSAPAPDCAVALASLKAERAAPRHAGALVIGADQMLECDGEWFDKPADRAAAAAQLRRLAGRTHVLHSAVAVLRDGARLWHHVEPARLTMRALSDGFLARYLDAAGDAVTQSVGAYQLEGLGVQLFSHVDGDHFTIMGLPLLPLLGFLREHGAVPA